MVEGMAEMWACKKVVKKVVKRDPHLVAP